MLVSSNQHYTIFSRLFCLNFLIEGIKPNVEKKFKTCFIFLRDCLGEGSREEEYEKKQFCFFSFRLGGGNKNFIQNKRENILLITN